MNDMAEVTGAQAINQALWDAMSEDKNVIVFGEDVADREGGGVVGISKGLSTKFGNRVRSTPISEQAMVGAAIGAAMVGMRPVVEIMLMNFCAVAMDMIVNHAAKLRFMSGGQTHVPMVLRTMTGSGLSNGGQHSDFLEAWFAHTPGLKVVIPSNPADAYGLIRSCIEDDDPCIFVEPLKVLFQKGPPPVRGSRVPLGVAKVIREGSDVSVITYGPQTPIAIGAADKLRDTVSVEVVDLRTVAPFDLETVLGSVRKTGRAIILHEAVKSFGVGAEIASRITESLFGILKTPVARVGGAFSPVPFSKPLETAFAPSPTDLESAIRRVMS
ncbi:MAG TPA: alpha-ketoacid dehydrogenase subunit beta [Steroidobacteraceae bacterium]|jgi:pyruvate dehydrogenase E1 component beta subunit